MNIADICRNGEIGVGAFVELFAYKRAMRTHLLRVSDYVVFPYFRRNDAFKLEKIATLDFLDKGDFSTDNGSFGPISGNVFIMMSRRTYQPFCLLVGDMVGVSEESPLRCPIKTYVKNHYKRKEQIALPGFEPGSRAPKARMLGHYTIGL